MDFLIGSEMSEIWPFYLLFKANDFAGLLGVRAKRIRDFKLDWIKMR
jgi:hypothetical protein